MGVSESIFFQMAFFKFKSPNKNTQKKMQQETHRDTVQLSIQKKLQ